MTVPAPLVPPDALNVPLVTPLVRDQIDDAVAAFRQASNIAIFSHVNPDGDTLGCLLALGIALRRMGKRVTLISADGVPDTLRFLPEAETIQTGTDRTDFELAVVVDAGDLSRVGSANRPVVEAAPLVIDIDHHVTAGAFGQIRLLDASAAATGEIIYDLLYALGAEIDLSIATCLLTALLTDTGSFRYLNVTPRTMALGGAMVALGAVPNDIAEAVYENRSWAAQKLLGRALDCMRRSDDGRITWTRLSKDDFTDFNATDQDTEGIISAVRAVHGSEVALLLREMPNGKIRVSLRARPPADVSLIAAHFGGGGHRLASGCTLDGPLEMAEANLIAETHRILDQTTAIAPA